jgi:hypothetical protein
MAVSKIPFTLFNKVGVEEKRRYLRFDLNALADFEQEVGMGFPMLMQSRAIFAATRALAWAGLKWQDRTLSIQGVGDLIQQFVDKGGDMSEVLGACMKAAQDQGALGKNKPEEDLDLDLPESEEGKEQTPVAETPANLSLVGSTGSNE